MQQGELRRFPIEIYEQIKDDRNGMQTKLGVKGELVVEEDVTGDDSPCRPAMRGASPAD